MSGERRTAKPLAAIGSQAIVAGASLVLQLVALRSLGTDGLGRFALLFGVLVTINSIQSGWLGDSLTVLDRFDPGIRRALIRSQFAIVVLVFITTTALALPVEGIDTTTAIVFGLASVAWVVEETFRRLLIARREFTKLLVNDASFACGSFALIGFVALTGTGLELETLILALLAGAVVAIGVGVFQLPNVELSRGLLGPSKMRTVASFAVWRSMQVGLRPGSQAVVRWAIVGVASYEALGQLEGARLLLAPVLTVVNGAGVYLLPTYSGQARAGRRFSPAVPVAMAGMVAIGGAYGAAAFVFRGPLVDLLTDGSTIITGTALLAWSAYAIGFGAGVPVGNAVVARGRSRVAFSMRVVDAAVGITCATAIAAFGAVDAAPFGLALGTAVGAALLLNRLRRLPVEASGSRPGTDGAPPQDIDDAPAPPMTFDAIRPLDDATGTSPMQWAPVAAALPPPKRDALDASAAPRRAPTWAPPAISGPSSAMQADRWLWLLPIIAIIATEYKFRRRAIDEALGGSVDIVILLELAVYALMGAWTVWRLAPTKPRLTPLTVVMWGYILSTAASAVYSSFPLLGMARAVQLVILGAIIHALATQGRLIEISRLLHAWIILITVSIGIGLAYVFPTTGPQEGRFTWLHVHSVSAGSMMALSIPILFGLWLSARRRDNPTLLPWSANTYALLLAVHIVFLLASRTRGSIGGAFVALCVMSWIWTGRRAKPQLVLASLVAGSAILLTFGSTILAFLARGESVEKIGTFNRRTEIWTLAWESFLARPLQGLGFTSAKGVFFDETGLGGAHNAVINVMIDVGLVGLLWWGGLLLGVGIGIARLGRIARRDELLEGAAGSGRADHLILLGLLVSSLVNSVTTEGLGAGVNVSAIWLYLMVAWLAISQRAAARRDDEILIQFAASTR